MSNSVWPHRWHPTRLPHPGDSPGKNTGVGCHFLLQWMKVKSESQVTQLSPTLSDPMGCSLPGSSIHGIFQGRVLEWGAIMESVQFSSVAQSCPTLCNPMNRSPSGLPVYHQLPVFTQTHVHRVSDAIQPSHPLSSPSPPAPNPSQQQSLFQWVNSLHEVAKVLEFQLQHHSFQRNPRADLLQNGLVGSPCSARDTQVSSPTP